MKQSLLIFDGNNILNRGYHAVPNLTAPDGTPTGAIKGALNIMLKHLRECKPTHVGCVFDHRSENFRHRLYPEYKSNRIRDPYKEQQLSPQKTLMRALLKSLGLRVIHKRGYEADDIIGVLAKLGLTTLIISNDKDFAQLLDKKISLLRVTGSGDHRAENLITHTNCETYIGVPPQLVIEMLMLMGDKVDNIPGVKGVAEKTAAKLLQEHGSIRGVLLVEDRLTPKLRENFEEARKLFNVTRKLTTIRSDIITYDSSRLIISPPDEREFTDLCRHLGLKDLRDHALRVMEALNKRK